MTFDSQEFRPRLLSRPAVAAITLLVALGPISTDLYLPALPAIAAHFAIGQAEAQATLSVFLIGFAGAMLVVGPLSDRFGRRPVLGMGVGLFALASLGCALADNIGLLVFFRFLQALGASTGPIVCRAMVRDSFSAAEAGRVLSYLSAAMALAPAVGPILGGFLAESFGWWSTFLFLCLYGAVGLLAILFVLPETNVLRSADAFHPLAWAGTYRGLLRHRRYLGFVLAATFGYSGIFCFISGSSFVFIDLMKLTPKIYGFCFAIFVIGYIVGAVAGGRLTLGLGAGRMVAMGTMLALASALVLAGVQVLLPPSVPGVLGPLFFYMIGIGMTLPNAQAGAIGPFPRQAGAASALLGFVQMALASGIGAILGLIGSASTLPMALMILLTAILQLAAYRLLVGRAA